MAYKDIENRRRAGRERNRRYRDSHPESVERQRAASRVCTFRRTQENKVLLRSLLGGACVVCTETNPRLLDFDHIANDGHTERLSTGRIMSGYSSAYRELRRNGEDGLCCRFQLLCRGCHQEKTARVRRERLEGRSQPESFAMPLFSWAELACTRLDDIFSQALED